jgi:hypothetical protein
MHQKFSKTLVVCLFTFAFCCFAKAQSVDSTRPNVIVVGGMRTAEVIGKGAVIILKQTAKATWKVTKFAATEVAEPTAKIVIFKATPKATSFLIKNSGHIIKKSTPFAKKLLVTYLKL